MPFQKGNKLGVRRKKGDKAAKTIAKEKARQIFEETQLKYWQKISETQAKRALKDDKAREYVINQVIGKAKETVEHEGEISLKIDI